MIRRMQALVIVRVRCLCRFRTPPNQIPYATRSDSVRCPIRFRTRTAKTHIDTIKGNSISLLNCPYTYYYRANLGNCYRANLANLV